MSNRIHDMGCPDSMSDRAVYLGDGVWWQLTNDQVRRGFAKGLPERVRPPRDRYPFRLRGRTSCLDQPR